MTVEQTSDKIGFSFSQYTYTLFIILPCCPFLRFVLGMILTLKKLFLLQWFLLVNYLEALFGLLADKHGHRPIVLAIVLVTALGCALSGASRNYVALVSFRFVAGVGVGAILICMLKCYHHLSEERTLLPSTYFGL